MKKFSLTPCKYCGRLTANVPRVCNECHKAREESPMMTITIGDFHLEVNQWYMEHHSNKHFWATIKTSIKEASSNEQKKPRTRKRKSAVC